MPAYNRQNREVVGWPSGSRSGSSYSGVGKAGHMGKGPYFIDAREGERDLMSAVSARSVSHARGVDRVRALQRGRVPLAL